MTRGFFTLPGRHLFLIGGLSIALFGCSRCGDDNGPLTETTDSPLYDPNAPGWNSDGDYLPERPRPGETVLAENLETVYFAYDSDNLDAVAQSAIAENAEWLRDNPDLNILVEGHCDERGTDAYNYSLGERRATAVRAALLRAGVENNLYTRSYGETRPAVEGHTESAWRYNRRVQFSLYID